MATSPPVRYARPQWPALTPMKLALPLNCICVTRNNCTQSKNSRADQISGAQVIQYE